MATFITHTHLYKITLVDFLGMVMQAEYNIEFVDQYNKIRWSHDLQGD